MRSDYKEIEKRLFPLIRVEGYGRGSKNTEQVDYHKGMTVLHEQYNQILQMLGQSNMQGGSEAATSTSHFSASIAQDNYSSAGASTDPTPSHDVPPSAIVDSVDNPDLSAVLLVLSQGSLRLGDHRES
ncbi:hypothetical protein H5410_045384 [Solanum commersonii]|uniref:Uncharacterized protein n=1 Tax=Solanum commersonii TaxID=4109 RepID=A0A9J5XCJ2_SOLCO|nr:hypothetical protein H5410_045384 [Solanum commersonii]